jgi:hypothetical protein
MSSFSFFFEVQDLTKRGYNVKLKHVKGHQDTTTAVDQLSKESRLNVQADKIATNALKSKGNGIYCEFTANPVSLWVDNEPITSKVKTFVRKALKSTNK